MLSMYKKKKEKLKTMANLSYFVTNIFLQKYQAIIHPPLITSTFISVRMQVQPPVYFAVPEPFKDDMFHIIYFTREEVRIRIRGLL